MAKKVSAGLIPYRLRESVLEVFLVHPGGPFWARKDDGAWSIAKGEFAPGGDPLSAARREFTEETGFVANEPFIDLGSLKQRGGKMVHAFACEADYDPDLITSNTFEIEWPPHSGRRRQFPEVDRAAWFTLEEARAKILLSQAPFLATLEDRIVRTGTMEV